MLELSTGSRLHFGLLELAPGHPNRFGGLGLMIDWPGVVVRIEPARLSSTSIQPSVTAEIADRIAKAVRLTEEGLGQRLPPEWNVRLAECPVLHSGLGLGTQLSAAVSTAVRLAITHNLTQSPDIHWQNFFSWSDENAATIQQQLEDLVRLTGRGKRSAIGLRGFLTGGLVFDLGHSASAVEFEQGVRSRTFDTSHVYLPSAWRVVLITDRRSSDMHGQIEDELIQEAASASASRREELLALSSLCMRSATQGDYPSFVECLERYMLHAAELFKQIQHGLYRNSTIANRVDAASTCGLRAVGQSSWGPTVFGFAPDHASATQAVLHLRNVLADPLIQINITSPTHHGARWHVCSSGIQHAR